MASNRFSLPNDFDSLGSKWLSERHESMKGVISQFFDEFEKGNQKYYATMGKPEDVMGKLSAYAMEARRRGFEMHSWEHEPGVGITGQLRRISKPQPAPKKQPPPPSNHVPQTPKVPKKSAELPRKNEAESMAEQINKRADILPNQVEPQPRVPKKSAIVPTKASKVPDPQSTGQPNRVTSVKPPPDPGPVNNKTVTPASVSRGIDDDTARQVMDENKNATTGKLSHELDSAEAKENIAKSRGTNTVAKQAIDGVKQLDTEAEAVRGLRNLSKVRAAGWLGLGLIAAGTLADVSNKLADERQTKRMVMEEKRNLQKKELQERKDMRKMFGYDYVNYGNIVKEMWDNRTGHYKMGNAKYQ